MLNIVLSGGPSGGKSTSLAKICSELYEKLGIQVLVVPETATELIANGIIPDKNIPLEKFQELALDKQLFKEEMYEKALSYYDKDKTVILYDRGIFDQMAYLGKPKFEKLLESRGLTIADVNNRYDAIIHLTTAAKGTDCYTTANNVARRETAEEAILADDRTLAANMVHPHVRVVDNSTNFEQKVQRVLKHIFDMLGAPAPSEIERKFLIKKPTDNILSGLNFSSKSEIIQTYLKSTDENIERRVRQRGSSCDGYSFYYTEKTKVSMIERVEIENKISMKEYINYLTESDTSLHQIRKTRYCFLHENQYFEIDIYPFSDDYAIMEIELSSADDKVVIPEFIDVIKEVTDDNDFKNHSLAKTLKFNI
jgi:CYTH domain-containing protein/predicted ATPase